MDLFKKEISVYLIASPFLHKIKTYLLSKLLEFVEPAFNDAHAIINICGLLKQVFGRLHDAHQSAVPQLLYLNIQGCEIWLSLQVRNFDTKYTVCIS